MDTKLTTSEKRDIVIESCLQLIPYVGGAISTAYFSTKQATHFKRLENFYTELSQRMIELQGQPVDEQSEECLIAIIERLNDKVEKEASAEKRKYFQNFFLNLLRNPITENNYDERQMLLESLDAITYTEFQVLLSHSQYKDLTNPFIEQLDPALKAGATSRLSNLGLLSINYIVETYVGQSPVHTHINLSSFGEKFIKFCTK